MVNDRNDEAGLVRGRYRAETLGGIRCAFRGLDSANKEVTDRKTVMNRHTVGTFVITGSNRTKRWRDDGNSKTER